MELADFLLARIAEDEAAAIAARDTVEPDSYIHHPDTPQPGLVGAHWGAVGDGWGLVYGEGTSLWDCEGSKSLCMVPVVAEHVARHDPARVLAECEAKRQFVAWFDREDTQYSPRDGIHAGLRILATIYADHPDFHDEWR